MRRRAAVLCLLAACQGAPEPARATRRLVPTPGAAAQQVDPVAEATEGAIIARVAGQPVTVDDLLRRWLHRASPEVRTYLEELVLARLVLVEARRLDIRLERSLVDERVEQSLARMAAEIEKSGSKLGTREYVRQQLGLDPDNYERALREDREIDLLAERCVRAWLLESERAEVRVIVLDEREAMETVRAALAEGEPFEELAEEHSIEASAGEGGRIPPVVRSDSALSRLAFSTPVGQVGGPVEEGGRWLFLRVDARPKADEGPWREIGPAVEASLAERDIEDPEYWQWKEAMVERYEVDMTPFLELVGEPRG